MEISRLSDIILNVEHIAYLINKRVLTEFLLIT